MATGPQRVTFTEIVAFIAWRSGVQTNRAKNTTTPIRDGVDRAEGWSRHSHEESRMARH
jgi:hypothetical protein